MNAILDPAMLMMSQEDWKYAKNEDEFLKHFLGITKVVDEYDLTNYYWCDEYENHFWKSLPFQNSQERNSIITVIYKRINSRTIDVTTQLKTCSSAKSNPELYCPIGKEACLKSLYSMAHQVIVEQERVFLCLGLANKSISKLDISCSCHNYVLSPILISSPDGWYLHFDYVTHLWPTDATIGEIKKLLQAIHIQNLKEQRQSKFLYTPTFSKRFIKQIVNEKDSSDNILSALGKRLTMSHYDSAKDNGLCDEEVHTKKFGKTDWFRTSRGGRIGYFHPASGLIEFTFYLRPNEHQKELK